MSKTVLITGASSGLGEAIAEIFIKNNFKVIGVCRSEPKIKVDYWYKCDITVAEERQELVDKVKSEAGRLDVLINNAGKGNYAPWEEFSEEELRDLFELNFFALVDLTRLFLPMLKESRGTVINIASVAGKSYVPCMGAYCASKFALCAFSDSLRAELKNIGVNVLNVKPGRINTGFSSRALGARKTPETPSGGSTPQGLAKRLFRAYRRKKRSLIYPKSYVFFIWFTRMFPRLYDWAACKAWKLDKE
jgi:short-subunit dehydrogenase